MSEARCKWVLGLALGVAISALAVAHPSFADDQEPILKRSRPTGILPDGEFREVEARDDGHLCEDRIKTIRDDIRSQRMSSLRSTSYRRSSTLMNRAVDFATIECVGPGDRDYPIQASGVPNICRFDSINTSNRQITCDSVKFNALDESEQYALIHAMLNAPARTPNSGSSDSDF